MKKGEQTRQKILDESAKLFAAHGFSGTSVRQIADAANVNVAAISMYFDSKDGLYQSILSEGFEDLVRRRRAALSACTSTPEPKLDEVLKAFVLPLFELLDANTRQADFLRILSRTLFEPNPGYVSASRNKVKALMGSFVEALRLCVPDLEPGQIRQRLGFAVGAISQALADPNRPPGTGARRELLQFLNAAFTGAK